MLAMAGLQVFRLSHSRCHVWQTRRETEATHRGACSSAPVILARKSFLVAAAVMPTLLCFLHQTWRRLLDFKVLQGSVCRLPSLSFWQAHYLSGRHPGRGGEAAASAAGAPGWVDGLEGGSAGGRRGAGGAAAAARTTAAGAVLESATSNSNSHYTVPHMMAWQ